MQVSITVDSTALLQVAYDITCVSFAENWCSTAVMPYNANKCVIQVYVHAYGILKACVNSDRRQGQYKDNRR